MPHLGLSLLGSFQVAHQDEPFDAFTTDKVRALLAYLAVEADRPHRRQSLAGLLWPDSAESAARTNLRQTLYQLRQTIGDNKAPVPHLLVSTQEIQLNPAGDSWLDAQEFDDRVAAYRDHHALDGSLCEECRQRLERAVTLYRGDFLMGFSLPDSPPFEVWQLVKQEHYHRQALQILLRLGDHYEADGDYAGAAHCARRAVELEPWLEPAHRRLMRALALDQQRDQALKQYAACRQILKREMGTAPSSETDLLFAPIRDGRILPRIEQSRPPPVQTASPEKQHTGLDRRLAPFVGREQELGILNRHLDTSLTGQGRVVFVRGEAGSGKSTLLTEFARQAAQVNGDLLVAAGRSSAQYGLGETCEPFRQILRMLTVDFDAAEDDNMLPSSLRQRLWAALPNVLSILLDWGQDLVGSCMPVQSLGVRAILVSGLDPVLRARLDALLARHGVSLARTQDDGNAGGASARQATAADLSQPALAQSILFDQFTRVLCELSLRRPLLLLLDDLQWVDPASCSLLFHLARHLASSRLLIVGAYHPEDLALGDGHHPLQPVIRELESSFGEIQIDLAQADHRSFLEAYLDSEPNRLDITFRNTFYRHTEGHALFTAELLRDLQARGQLVREANEGWTASPGLDWGELPARVEAMVARRVERTAAADHLLLEAASVQGEFFIVEVLAAVLGDDEIAITRRLSNELGREHGLVESHGYVQAGDRHLWRYRFRHHLFQQHLYQSLDSGLRAQYHRATAEVLKGWRSAQPNLSLMHEFRAVRLAWHFEQAGLIAQAIPYLLEAGQEAYRLSAHEQAISRLTRGLELLEQLPPTPDRDRLEYSLQAALSQPLRAQNGYAAELTAHRRAAELARQLDEPDLLASVSFVQFTNHLVRGEYREAKEITERLQRTAGQTQKPAHLLQANFQAAQVFLFAGRLLSARSHLDTGLALLDKLPDDHTVLQSGNVGKLNVAHIAATLLWLQGYPDQALAYARLTLVEAKKLGHAYWLALAQNVTLCQVYLLRREGRQVQETAVSALHTAQERHFPLMEILAKTYLGCALIESGEVKSGLAQLEEELARYQASKHRFFVTLYLAYQANAYGIKGEIQRGLDVISTALDLADQGDHLFEAELHRLRGDLLLAKGDESQAEVSFQQAVRVAKDQGARSLELRAALSLARLWQRQGRPAKAHSILTPIYNWFSEGFDTPDLQEAGTVLAELSEAAATST